MRNPTYNAYGSIDCEIEIQSGEWVPFTASPNDVEAHGRAIYADALEAGPAAYIAPVIDPAIALAQSRAGMVISPLQGILTLGETEWGKVLAFRDGFDKDGKPFSSWGEKVIINSAQDWRRDSQNIAFFGYLLGYSPEQMDALFIAAAQVKA